MTKPLLRQPLRRWRGEETEERALATPELVVVDLEAEKEAPAPTEPAGEGTPAAEDKRPVPAKPTTERAADEVPTLANEGGAGLSNEKESGETDSGSLPASATIHQAVRKVSSLPPRPPPQFIAMEDAQQAECLLERLHLPRFCAQLRQGTAASLLDASYVLVLQMANELLTLRDTIINSSISTACSAERATKYQGRCKEITEKFNKKLEEAKAQENELGGKLIALEINHDEWVARHREAKNMAAIELVRTSAAKTKLALVSARLASTESRVDELA